MERRPFFGTNGSVSDRIRQFITKKTAAIYVNTPNNPTGMTLDVETIKEIAEIKMPDLNASSIDSAMRMIAGTARSMGIVVKG